MDAEAGLPCAAQLQRGQEDQIESAHYAVGGISASRANVPDGEVGGSLEAELGNGQMLLFVVASL